MTIDALMDLLKKMQAAGQGAMPVVWQSMRHIHEVEPVVKDASSGKVLLVNP